MRHLLFLLALAAVGRSQDPLANVTSADIERGKKLFRSNCAGCHGIEGEGGSGPALTRGKFKRARDNAALVELIINGIGTAGMPPSWHLLPDGPTHIAAYIRTLGQVNEPAVVGDVGHGASVYRSTGCANCHVIRREGKGFGPDLTDIGARRTSESLRRSLTHPGESSSEEYLLVRVQTADGKTVRGIRLNEDSFTIQIKDPVGAFHSYRKSDLAKLEKLFDQSLMPAYSTMPAPDLQDLVAYLSSLRGDEQ